MKPLLSVNNLYVDFLSREKKAHHAVLGVDFALQEGEIVGLVGETGCGKSAVAKALIQLFPKQTVSLQGEVLFQGKNLLCCSSKELESIRGKEIGMIFQDPMTSLNPTMSIGKQIAEAYLKSQPKASSKEAFTKTIEILQQIGIREAEKRIFDYPHTLSGGMRQRILIAIALISKPKLLIADEPTTALDVTVQAQILSLLKSIQKNLQMTMLLITHDLSVVAGFCDRVLVMYGGKIIESAPVESLFYDPKHPYTKRLLQAAPKINSPQGEPLIPIEGAPPESIHLLEGCSFYPRCDKAFKLCKSETPPLISLEKDHCSRCWLHKERL